MKKRLLSILMCVVMLLSITACGNNAATDAKDKADRTFTESKTSEEKDITDKSGLKENTGGTSESVSETPETTDAGESSVTDTAETDKTYTAQTLMDAMPKENVRMYIDGITFEMEIAGNNMSLKTGGNDPDTGDQVKMEMYVIGSDMYVSMCDLTTGEATYQHAMTDAETDTDSIKEGVMTTDDLADLEGATVEYKEHVTLDDVPYDVIHVVYSTDYASENGTVTVDGTEQMPEAASTYEEADYYINTDTGMVERIATVDNSTNEAVTIFIEQIDGIVLPETFSTEEVVEISSEEMAMNLFAIMFLPFSSMDTESTESAE